MASSSQRAGTQPPLSLWILNLCKDSCSWEEVITTPNSPAGSGLAIAREEWEGNVSSLSHNNRQWQIYTPVVSQRMRWCLLTLHRKAESCSCSSDPAERKTGGKNTLQNTLSCWPAYLTRVRGGGWAESSVALAKQSLTWQMVLSLCFCVPPPWPWLINGVHYIRPSPLPSCDSTFWFDSDYPVREMVPHFGHRLPVQHSTDILYRHKLPFMLTVTRRGNFRVTN